MQTATIPKERVQSIDLLRGLVMIIMALDHVRDFTHSQAWVDDPLNLATTTPMLFFTRWITHFCAPVFVFLAGTSIYLQGLRKSPAELSGFLFKRGVWLILVEVSVINLAFSYDISYSMTGLQVIWAIGISMVILALFIRLPFAIILTTGLVIVLGHNLLDIYEEGRQNFSVWYSLLHRMGFYPMGKDHTLLVLYPFLSWAGLMMLGYCFGRLIISAGENRAKLLYRLGMGIILLFIVVRIPNVYGDPLLWSTQKNPLYSTLSFINTRKYPPSLLYMCMTIGPAIIFLAIFDKARGWLAKIISVYGRVPFFYYILHFFLAHALCTAMFFANGHSVAEGTHREGLLPNFVKPGEGVSLGWVYVIWIALVAALYPLCKWYDRYKASHREKWWLSYL